MLRRNKVSSHAILILLLISTVTGIIHFGSGNVFADTPEVWNQTSGALASTDANWLDGTKPIAGDNIIFNATSTASCTFDLALALGSFTMTADYSGVITQAASFSITSYSQAAGTFTGTAGYLLTDNGGFIQTGGTISQHVLNLKMTGSGYSISTTTDPYTWQLQISGDTTLATAHHIDVHMTIDSGKTFTLNAALGFASYSGSTWSNLGIVAGSSLLSFTLYNADMTQTFGVINSPASVTLHSAAAASRALTMTAVTVLGSTLSITSAHTTYTATLDLSSSNHNLSATDITIGTRGILNGRASTITCSGNWDSSAGTFTAGTSTLVMTGSSKTIKTANTNGAPYNFQESGTTTTSSSVNVTHSLTVDTGKTLTIGAGKTVDLNCSNGGTYSNLGTIAGTGTMEYSFSTADKTLAFGVVNAPVRVRAISIATANRTMTLSSDRVLGSTLLVNSDHASNTMTVDARAVYLGAVGAITEGTRGDILYATFSFVSSPGYGGGVQTMHSYTYETNLSTTASPGQVYTFTSNATWLDWDSTDLAVYGTPDSVFGGHWYYVNISVADGMLSTYQNYTVLVVPVETLQDYIPLLMALLFGFGLLIAGLKFRELWILAGPVWIICGLTIFIPYGVVFLLVSIGLGIVLMFKGVSPYL